MKLKMVVNNYIYGVINKQLRHYVESDTKIDRSHHEIIFNVSNDREIQFIQKITTYKGEIIN